VLKAGAELPAFELEGFEEWESIQPGRGGAAGAAEESGPGALAILSNGGIGGVQGACTGLRGVLGDRTLRLCDDTLCDGVWAGLAGLRRPNADGSVCNICESICTIRQDIQDGYLYR
jgi:hypothetical protein